MKKVLLALVTILLVGGFTFVYMNDRAAEKVEENRHTALLKQVRTYEKEIEEIENDLVSQEKEAHSVLKVPTVMPAFYPSNASDMKRLERLARAGDFIPIIVIDCSLPEDVITSFMKDIKGKNFEVMLTASEFTKEAMQQASKVRSALPDQGFDSDVAFLMLQNVDTQENYETVRTNGYHSIAAKCDLNAIEVKPDGMPVIPYVVAGGFSSSMETMTLISDYRSYLLYVFDFKALEEDDMMESDMSDVLTYMQQRVSSKTMAYSTIAEAVDEIPGKYDLLQKQLQNYAKSLTEQSKRVAELEKNIAEVYSHWDG